MPLDRKHQPDELRPGPEEHGLDAFVTQLRSLAEAERFVRAGIPVVASLKPGVFGLDGYLFPGSPEGHLLVIRGLDAPATRS